MHVRVMSMKIMTLWFWNLSVKTLQIYLKHTYTVWLLSTENFIQWTKTNRCFRGSYERTVKYKLIEEYMSMYAKN
jgi:hypothetical protein